MQQYASLAPVKICGDFNTALPVENKLVRNWFKQKPYNLHSAVLIGNNLVAVDILFN